jgi:hypothetical protein
MDGGSREVQRVSCVWSSNGHREAEIFVLFGEYQAFSYHHSKNGNRFVFSQSWKFAKDFGHPTFRLAEQIDLP